MTTAKAGNSGAPKITLTQVSSRRESGEGLWRILWRVENLGSERLRLKTLRFPHGQFKAEEQNLGRRFTLDCGEPGEFEATIACDGKAGNIVENAFAIFSVTWKNKPWRIFVRLRVSMSDDGTPAAIAESITTQRAGFSTAVLTEG